MVDFNHPLAGKNVIYEIHVLRKVEDLNEKIKAVISFLFRRELEFSVQEKKIVIEIEKQQQFVMEKIKMLTSEVTIKSLEADVDKLEQDRIQAAVLRDKKEDDQIDTQVVINYLKYYMEEILLIISFVRLGFCIC